MLDGIHWLGHASFRIDAGKTVVYIDPWKLPPGQPAADLILITHAHHDHLSAEDVHQIARAGTVIVCPTACMAQLAGDVRGVAPGDRLTIQSIEIEAVEAYNTDKPNHPRSARNVGYVLTIGERRIYHAGDTDLIPEMDAIRCDVAMLPIGGTYTMNARQAADAAAHIKPQVVIPMHWGDIVGSQRDVDVLTAHVPQGVRVAALTPER